jgi:hypothetical protein
MRRTIDGIMPRSVKTADRGQIGLMLVRKLALGHGEMVRLMMRAADQ